MRKGSVALPRGLQVNGNFGVDTAEFFRVYENDGVAQSALVLLNESDEPVDFIVDIVVSVGSWRDALADDVIEVSASQPVLTATVGAHGVRVLLYDKPATNEALLDKLDALQVNARRMNPE